MAEPMLSLWAMLSERDVEAYAAGLVLPAYLAHLSLSPVRFAAQVRNSDGREPLVLGYVGEGRVEEYRLHPEDHALAMIRFVCPGIVTSRVQLPPDDASWHWGTAGEAGEVLRVYFAPTSQALGAVLGRPIGQESYVSVSRRQVFVGRPVVEAYVTRWLERLGIEPAEARFDFGTPSSGIEFVAGAVGGQMFVDDSVATEDLLRFAGLDKVVAALAEFVELDLDGPAEEGCGVFDDGVYLRLAGPADVEDAGNCEQERP